MGNFSFSPFYIPPDTWILLDRSWKKSFLSQLCCLNLIACGPTYRTGLLFHIFPAAAMSNAMLSVLLHFMEKRYSRKVKTEAFFSMDGNEFYRYTDS